MWVWVCRIFGSAGVSVGVSVGVGVGVGVGVSMWVWEVGFWVRMEVVVYVVV